MFTGIFRRLPRAAAGCCPGGIRGRRPARVGGRIPRSSDPLAGALQRRRRATSPRASWPGTWPTRWASRWWSRTVPARPPSSPPGNRARRADGYTLMTAGMSTLALNPWLYRKLPYDPQKNLAPVSTLVDLPIVLVVSPDSEPAYAGRRHRLPEERQGAQLRLAGRGQPAPSGDGAVPGNGEGQGHRHPLGHAAGLAGRGLGCGALDDGRSGRRA